MAVSIRADYEAKARPRRKGFRYARCRWTSDGLAPSALAASRTDRCAVRDCIGVQSGSGTPRALPCGANTSEASLDAPRFRTVQTRSGPPRRVYRPAWCSRSPQRTPAGLRCRQITIGFRLGSRFRQCPRTQSIFRVAARRMTVSARENVDRRVGARKMCWTKPLAGCRGMEIKTFRGSVRRRARQRPANLDGHWHGAPRRGEFVNGSHGRLSRRAIVEGRVRKDTKPVTRRRADHKCRVDS